MSANQVELTELKEWLTNEVKLERYFEKLTKYGFNSLSLIQNLEESDLDSVGITPPYHRKRMLKFCKDLQIKQAPHVNKECARTGNDPNELGLSTRLEERNEDYEHNFDDSNEEAKIEPPPLPPKLGSGDVYTKPKPVVPDVESSLPRQLADYNTESNTPTTSATADSSKTKQIEAKEPNLLSKTLPGLETNSSSFSECKEVKKPKKPPPIPRRSDLESETVVSCEAQGGKIDETNGDNEQIDLAQDIEKTGDSTAEMPYYFTEKASAPKPVPRPRVGKEKPLSAPRSLANQPTHCSEVTKYAKNELVEGRELPCSEGECAQKSKVDSEPIYCNKEECLQAIVAPLREVEKPANKKPLPLPRQKPQQLSLAQQAESDKLRFPLLHGQERNQEFRHSIAVSGQFTNKPADEEEKATQLRNGALHTRSLHRLDKLVPVVSQHEIFKKPASLTKESTAIYTSVQPNHHKPVSPSADFDEQDVFGGVPKDNKVSSEYLGTYEVVKMPNDRNRPESQEEIYEPLNDYGKSNNPNDYSMAGEIEPSKKKKSTAEDVIYDYESDESTEGLLLEEPPELPEERKTRRDSTDSFDAKLPKSVTPKSRKTSGYLFKQGGQQNNRGWKKRWFVFDGKELRYYRCKENTQESLHVIPVSQMKNIEFEKEAKKGRFNLITANRVFMLSSDSMTDTNLWAQTLMEAILQYKGDDSTKKNGGMMSDPDKEGWLKKQGHNVMGDWKRRYVAIKEDIICYYDTYEDFTYETPIHCVEAKLASVKQDLGHRNRFLIVTPYKAFSFQAENEFEAASWISAIQTAIQMGLSDHAVINQVWSNPANKKCADCGKKDPVWASVNYCICVCARCIGIHRSMGVKYSKPRSLLMDEKIWNMQLLELMLKVGNDNANKLLEFRIPDDDRINPDSDNEKRIEFIFSKYKDMKYMKISEDYGKREALGQSLQKAVVKDDILKTMELLINRADVKYTNSDSEDQRTPLELAKDAGQELQAELLRQNGADAIEEPSPLIPDEDAVGFVKVDAAELPPQPLAEVPHKAGYLLLLKKKYWFTLKDRHLKYFRNQMDKDPIGVLDLAAVTSLELHTSEDTRTLDIVTPEKAYTLKGESDEELESWYAAIKNKQVFNVHLGFQELGSDGIPHLVAHCLQFVETYGLQAEGVYRVSGNQAKIRALTQSFNQDASRVMLTLDDYSVHDVTGTLKKYLRVLPEPVVPDNMYKTFIMASCHPDRDTKLYAIKDALVKLPKVNYDTLKRIIGHLKKVIADQAINRMGIENISMIFAPTLMSNENTGKMDNTSINQEFKIIGDLIHYYEWFFDVDDKELIKDKLMEEARKKILQIQEPGQSGMNQEFNLDIYVQQKNDSPCLIKVAAGMTAGELCMNIIQKKALQPETNWALFEVIGKLNLQRAVHHREKVLPVVMSWEAFGEISKGNYLIIRENHIAESIQPFIGTSLTLEGQLHVREPKRKDWKLSTVILKNGYMVVDKSKSFFKTIKSDKSDNDQWSLHNLVVFLGVPSEKSTKGVDTSAGFTVVVKTDLNGNLMRYLCAKDRTEMYRWVAAILNMKHPEGIWTDPIAAAELKTRRVKDEQIYLGRQSRYLRTEGSSKHIVQEISTRRKSLRRSGPVS